MTGLGGAYIGEAEGVEGAAVNSASPAVRDAYSYKWLDTDFSLGISLLGTFAGTDFDNQGKTPNGTQTTASDFVDLNFGANVQLGSFGATATGDLQQYNLSSQSAGVPALTLDIGRWKGLAAYGFFNGQLIVGGGLRLLTLQINQSGGGTLLTMTGVGPEVGALWMPSGYPWRIGATLRDGVSGDSFGSGHVTVAKNGTRSAGGYVLPTEVVMPWEAEVGFTYQLGPRPLNPPWENPHAEEGQARRAIAEDRERRAAEYQAALVRIPAADRSARAAQQAAAEETIRAMEDQRLDAEIRRLAYVRRARYANWPREKILLLASVLFTGPSQSAVSVSGFLGQRRQLVGLDTSLTPRLGIEGEPIHERLIARAGTYLEPSRYGDGFPRQHFTFGADVKLFPFDFWGVLTDAPWKIGAYVDLAPRFTNAGLSLGLWH